MHIDAASCIFILSAASALMFTFPPCKKPQYAILHHLLLLPGYLSAEHKCYDKQPVDSFIVEPTMSAGP